MVSHQRLRKVPNAHGPARQGPIVPMIDEIPWCRPSRPMERRAISLIAIYNKIPVQLSSLRIAHTTTQDFKLPRRVGTSAGCAKSAVCNVRTFRVCKAPRDALAGVIQGVALVGTAQLAPDRGQKMNRPAAARNDSLLQGARQLVHVVRRNLDDRHSVERTRQAVPRSRKLAERWIAG